MSGEFALSETWEREKGNLTGVLWQHWETGSMKREEAVPLSLSFFYCKVFINASF